jgi:hypothetical protein
MALLLVCSVIGMHAVRQPNCSCCVSSLLFAGHVPMLANPTFAEMVQAIGVASLGADEKQIWHLTKVRPLLVIVMCCN